MAETLGLHHLGLAVRDLDQTTDFFIKVLGWQELARDESYPRNAVTDGTLRLTLWQVTQTEPVTAFDRKSNIGLHNLALEVASDADLSRLSEKVSDWPGVKIEFLPKPMGDGPRRHMMFAEPGGIRIELIWPGT